MHWCRKLELAGFDDYRGASEAANLLEAGHIDIRVPRLHSPSGRGTGGVMIVRSIRISTAQDFNCLEVTMLIRSMCDSDLDSS